MKEINIKEIYKKECEEFDLIIQIDVWEKYYSSKPEYGNFINERMIKEVITDGVVYFIKLTE